MDEIVKRANDADNNANNSREAIEIKGLAQFEYQDEIVSNKLTLVVLEKGMYPFYWMSYLEHGLQMCTHQAVEHETVYR